MKGNVVDLAGDRAAFARSSSMVADIIMPTRRDQRGSTSPTISRRSRSR